LTKSAAKSPDITVLIPVRNGERFVAQAVQSVLEQSVGGVRVLASDNQSSDGTAQILERLAGDARVTLVRQPAPLSMAQHFNNCLGRVATDYYMLLCHDDYLASRDALQTAREILVSQPDVNAVYCDILYVDADRRRIATRRFDRDGRFDARMTARACVLTGRNLFGIPLLIRTRAVRGLAYDEALPYAGDVDIALAGAAGGAVFHVPQPLIANRYHAQNATWGVLTGVSGQMRAIAAKHGISLSAFERFRAVFSTWLTAVIKVLFRAYISIRR
jgi:glycosyltransferase involved in cell wall biosynthesis